MSDESGKLPEGRSQIVLYQTEDGRNRVQVRLENEIVWLTQNLMAELYQTTKQDISRHIQNIYDEGELTPEATVKKYLTVRKEGPRSVKRLLDYHNLDMIITVGYQVRSPRGKNDLEIRSKIRN
ncbi:MAG: RhuM family protein [bacterium]